MSSYRTSLDKIVLAGEVYTEPQATRMVWSNTDAGTVGEAVFVAGQMPRWNTDLIPLVVGSNTIVVHAWRDGNRIGYAAVDVIYDPDAPAIPVTDTPIAAIRVELGPGLFAALDNTGVTFADTAGEQSRVPLAFIDRISVKEDGTTMLAFDPEARDLFVWAQPSSPSVLRMYRFRLFGSGLPTSAVLQSATDFGDSDSRTGPLLRLASGALVVHWNQHTTGPRLPDGTFPLYHFFGYLPAGDTVWQTYPVTLYPHGDVGSQRMAMAQHPATGEVWWFGNRDSSHTIDASRLRETAGQLEVEALPTFIAEHPEHGPDGEHPGLSAIADPFRQKILLAYPSLPSSALAVRNLRDGANIGLQRGCPVTIAQVSADGSIDYLRLDTYLQRTSAAQVLPTAAAIYLAMAPMFGTTLNLYRYADGEWSLPTVLGEALIYSNFPYAPCYVNADRGEVVAQLADGCHAIRVGEGE